MPFWHHGDRNLAVERLPRKHQTWCARERYRPQDAGDGRHPDAPIELLAKEEPLINKEIERRQLSYAYNTLIDTPEARELGLGDVSDCWLKSAIATIATSFELPRLASPGDIFNRTFLPEKADRMPPAVAP